MTLLIKYPRQSKKRNEEWFKKIKAKNINWAQWGGWFDSDGSFSIDKTCKRKDKTTVLVPTIKLSIKDKEPVELFSQTFETSMFSHWCNTETPDGKKHKTLMYVSKLRSKRAYWFCDQIKKYIQQKTADLQKILKAADVKYTPYQEKWTRDEWIAYITTLSEGDGSFRSINGTGSFASLWSSNKGFLKFVKEKLFELNIAKYNEIRTSLYIKKGIPRKNPMYKIDIRLDEYTLPYLESILPYMTMKRKKDMVTHSINLLRTKI